MSLLRWGIVAIALLSMFGHRSDVEQLHGLAWAIVLALLEIATVIRNHR